jgi:fumarate hydratase subunit alpha
MNPEVNAMRTLAKDRLISEMERLVVEAATVLDDRVVACLGRAQEKEPTERARHIIGEILENQAIARTTAIPICQDTGVAVVFVELGRDLHLDFDLTEAINEGVRRGYQNGFLRKSVVRHPLDRVNTRDNTPAVIHLSLVPGIICGSVSPPRAPAAKTCPGWRC